ncbi:MAG: hypothetical protein JSW00_00140 [Thermoplasmata archaeon]|nr:MAG: hypothetical protein JSW00_00140 [Thermoplasmata archaeon]
MKISLGVIRKDKEILLFPLIAGIVMAVIGMTFILGIFFTGLFLSNGILMVVLFILLYFILYFIGIYFNTAVIGCATIRLQGGDPTLKDGFRIANENIKGILGWAVLAATVGLILRALEERMDALGRIMISLIGFAWTMATFFIIPVLIYEKVSVFKAVKRSAHVFKDTWGETFISSFGLGIIFFLFGLLGVIPIVLGIMAGGIWIWVGLSVGIVYFIVLFCISTAAQGVLTAALYRYATTGQVNIIPSDLMEVTPPHTYQDSGGHYPTYQSPQPRYKRDMDYEQQIPKGDDSAVVPVGYVKCPSCQTVNLEHESKCKTCGQYLR